MIYLDKNASGLMVSQGSTAKKVPKAYLQKVIADNRSKSTKPHNNEVINQSFSHFKK